MMVCGLLLVVANQFNNTLKFADVLGRRLPTPLTHQ